MSKESSGLGFSIDIKPQALRSCFYVKSRVWSGCSRLGWVGPGAGAGTTVRWGGGGIWHVDASANALWNSSTGFENYKECLEKVNLRIYTFAVVCIYSGVIIQTLGE